MSYFNRQTFSQDDIDLEQIIYGSKNAPKGIILYFHGGGLIFGTNDDLPKEYIEILTQNFILISADYRLAPESNITNILKDVVAQYDFIRLEYPNLPIFTFGRSAGAFLALKVAEKRQVSGIIDFYGYSRFHIPQFLRPNLNYQELSHKVTPEILNNLIQEQPITYGEVNSRYPIYLYARGQNKWHDLLGIEQSTDPLCNISPKQLKKFPATFIVHGKQDPDVPSSESIFLEKMIPETKLIMLESNEHDFDRNINSENITLYKKVEQFLLDITNKSI